MKMKAKKFITILLTMMMLFGTSVNVFADENPVPPAGDGPAITTQQPDGSAPEGGTEQDPQPVKMKGLLPKKGSVTITNLVINAASDDTPFTITVTGNAYKETFTLKSGEGKTLKEIPFGDYKVTEEKVNGYEEIGQKEFTVGYLTYWQLIPLVNKREVGNITFKKLVDNDKNNNEKFTVTVNDYFNPDKEDIKTIDFSQQVPQELKGLDPWHIYKIKEEPHKGYEYKDTQLKTVGNGFFDNIVFDKGWTFIGNIFGNKEVTIINHRTEGIITVKKVVDNDSSTDKEFTVKIAGPVNKDIKIKNGQSIPVDGLTAGEYTITEVKETGYSESKIEQSKVTIGDNNWEKTVTVTSHNDSIVVPPVTPKTGTITVTSAVSNESVLTDDEKANAKFDVILTGTGSNSPVKQNLKIYNGTVEIKDLPADTYTITEDLSAASAFKKSSITPETVTIGSESWTGSVTVTNEKTVAPPPPPITKGSIKVAVDVTNINNDATPFEVKISGGSLKETVVKTIHETDTNLSETADLDAGTYKIVLSPKQGYSDKEIEKSVELKTNDMNATVKFDIDRKTGSITISKDVNNIDNDATPFVIVVRNNEADFAKEIVISETDKAPYVINNLPVGKYTVVETAKSGYENVSNGSVTIDLGGENAWDQTVKIVNRKITVVPREPDERPVVVRDDQVPGAPVVTPTPTIAPVPTTTPVPTETPVPTQQVVPTDEKIPGGSAKLPATGEIPAGLFYMIGAAAIAAGTLFRRK